MIQALRKIFAPPAPAAAPRAPKYPKLNLP